MINRPHHTIAGHIFAYVAGRPDTCATVRDGVPFIATSIGDNAVTYVVRHTSRETPNATRPRRPRVAISAYFPELDDDFLVVELTTYADATHVANAIRNFETDVRRHVEERT